MAESRVSKASRRELAGGCVNEVSDACRVACDGSNGGAKDVARWNKGYGDEMRNKSSLIHPRSAMMWVREARNTGSSARWRAREAPVTNVTAHHVTAFVQLPSRRIPRNRIAGVLPRNEWRRSDIWRNSIAGNPPKQLVRLHTDIGCRRASARSVSPHTQLHRAAVAWWLGRVSQQTASQSHSHS